jgi:hypothetical protein
MATFDLRSGDTISPTQNDIDEGTLGFFGILQDPSVKPPFNVVLVTCAHVVTASGHGKDDSIYQITPKMDGTKNAALAGSIRDVFEDDVQDAEQRNFKLDCASVLLSSYYSSCCKTACGARFLTHIPGLNVPGVGDVIQDIERVPDNVPTDGSYLVYKVGRATKRTVGFISQVNGDAPDARVSVGGQGENVDITNTIQVKGVGGSVFAARGDSGSALVNAKGNLIGVVFAANAGISYACHADLVVAQLKITAVTAKNLPTPQNVYKDFFADARLDAAMMLEDPPNRWLELRQRLEASARGRDALALYDRHRQEILRLINGRRPVTVAWHRYQGPAFANRVIHNVRDPEERIPSAIQGITQRALLERMGAILAEHGSEDLRASIERHREELLAIAGTFDSIHDLVAAEVSP